MGRFSTRLWWAGIANGCPLSSFSSKHILDIVWHLELPFPFYRIWEKRPWWMKCVTQGQLRRPPCHEEDRQRGLRPNFLWLVSDSVPSFPLFGWNEPISDCSSQPHSSPYLLLPIRKAWGIPPLKDLPAHTLFALFQHSFEYSLATISKPVPVLDTEAENTSKSWLYLQGTQWHGRSSGLGSLFLNCG